MPAVYRLLSIHVPPWPATPPRIRSARNVRFHSFPSKPSPFWHCPGASPDPAARWSSLIRHSPGCRPATCVSLARRCMGVWWLVWHTSLVFSGDPARRARLSTPALLPTRDTKIPQQALKFKTCFTSSIFAFVFRNGTPTRNVTLNSQEY